MITKERNVEEMCSFYVSDFHFEMIALPYINKKIEENYEIKIVTENKLDDSVKILLDKINLDNDKKNKILKLDWNNSELVLPKENKKVVFFLKGKEEFINRIKADLEKALLNNNNDVIVIDCYDLEEIKSKMEVLMKKYKKILNILGEKEY